MLTIKTHTSQAINYQFFKAIYCNGNHYLCDVSKTMADNQLKYLIDIEIAGQGTMQVEMFHGKNGWQFAEMKNGADNNLERELSAMIFNHIQLH